MYETIIKIDATTPGGVLKEIKDKNDTAERIKEKKKELLDKWAENFKRGMLKELEREFQEEYVDGIDKKTIEDLKEEEESLDEDLKEAENGNFLFDDLLEEGDC